MRLSPPLLTQGPDSKVKMLPCINIFLYFPLHLAALHLSMVLSTSIQWGCV